MNQVLLLFLSLSFFSCSMMSKSTERAMASAPADSFEKKFISTYITDVVHFQMTREEAETFGKVKFQQDAYDYMNSEGVRFLCETSDVIAQKQICRIGSIPITPTGHRVMDKVAWNFERLDMGNQTRSVFLQENVALNCRKEAVGKNPKDAILKCDVEYYGLSTRQQEEKNFSLTFAEISKLRPLYQFGDRFETDTQAGKFICVRVKAKGARDTIQCQIGQTAISWEFAITYLAGQCQQLDHPQSIAGCLYPKSAVGWSYQCQIKDQATNDGVCHFKSNQGLYSAVRIIYDGAKNYREINQITTELLAANKVLSYKRLFSDRSYAQFCLQLDSLAAYQEFAQIKERYVKALSQYDKNLLWISFHKNCSSDLKDMSSAQQPGYVD